MFKKECLDFVYIFTTWPIYVAFAHIMFLTVILFTVQVPALKPQKEYGNYGVSDGGMPLTKRRKCVY
jgi:hypothetical protein